MASLPYENPYVDPYPGATQSSVDMRRRYALGVLQQAGDGTPTKANAIGAIARALQGAMGGYLAGQADQSDLADKANTQSLIQRLIGGGEASGTPANPSAIPPPSNAPVASAAPSQPTDASLPRGLRNNNPLNIEAGGFTQSQPGFSGSDGRFAKFQTPQQGMQAADTLLNTYQNKYGLNTPAGIVGRWAPSSDGNNVNSYAADVSQKLGIGPNDPIPPQMRPQLIAAMAQHENGRPLPQSYQVASLNPTGQPSPDAAPPVPPQAAPVAPVAPPQQVAQNAPQGGPQAPGQPINPMMNNDRVAAIAQLLGTRSGNAIGTAMLSRYLVPPQYDMMQQADGSVVAVNKLNPRDNYVAFKGTPKPIMVQPGATLVSPGSADAAGGPEGAAGGAFKPVYQNTTGLFDKDTLTSMSDQYLTGDKSVLQNLGRTAIGGMNISALRERIVSRAKEMGISPTEIASRIGQFDSYTSAQKATGTRGGNVTMAATEAGNLGNLVTDTSAAVPRTNYPVWNKVTNAYAENTGDPNIVKFTGALNSYINAYARAINPTGSTTVSDKEHAREILDTAMSKGQIEAGIGQLQKELDQAKLAPATSSDIIKKEFMSRSNPKNSEAMSQARDAISQGADRNAVIQRLQKLGIDPAGL